MEFSTAMTALRSVYFCEMGDDLRIVYQSFFGQVAIWITRDEESDLIRVIDSSANTPPGCGVNELFESLDTAIDFAWLFARQRGLPVHRDHLLLAPYPYAPGAQPKGPETA